MLFYRNKAKPLEPDYQMGDEQVKILEHIIESYRIPHDETPEFILQVSSVKNLVRKCAEEVRNDEANKAAIS